jgi:GNAT superfamily N-acetyltransferase
MVELLHKQMSWEEFENFPRHLGWKHEYYDGALHLSPYEFAIASLRLTISSQHAPITSPLRPIQRGDEQALIKLFEQCFRDIAEYAGWSIRAYKEEARENIHGFFEDRSWSVPKASLVAEEGGKMIGAALIRRIRRGPILQPIFVLPQFQRQGIGTGLLRGVVNRLQERGERFLYSRCHLGNPWSMSWHLKNGFEELPNLFVAQHRAAYFSMEAERLARLGDSAESAEFSRLTDYWRSESNRLESIKGDERMEVYGILD